MSLEMFTTSDITTAICRSCDKNEKLRLQALLLVKNGLSPAKVAEDFSVHRSTVHRWMKRAEEEGLFSLKCKPGRGVKSFLTSKQLSELRKALSEPIPTDELLHRLNSTLLPTIFLIACSAASTGPLPCPSACFSSP